MLKEQVGRTEAKTKFRDDEGNILVTPGDSITVTVDNKYYEGVVMRVHEDVMFITPKGGGQIVPIKI